MSHGTGLLMMVFHGETQGLLFLDSPAGALGRSESGIFS